MNQTVNTTLWHNNKAIISYNDQTNLDSVYERDIVYCICFILFIICVNIWRFFWVHRGIQVKQVYIAVALVKLSSIVRKTGYQTKQICNKWTWFYVRNSNAQDLEYTGYFYVYQKVAYSRTKQFVRIKANVGIHKIRNRQIIL